MFVLHVDRTKHMCSIHAPHNSCWSTPPLRRCSQPPSLGAGPGVHLPPPGVHLLLSLALSSVHLPLEGVCLPGPSSCGSHTSSHTSSHTMGNASSRRRDASDAAAAEASRRQGNDAVGPEPHVVRWCDAGRGTEAYTTTWKPRMRTFLFLLSSRARLFFFVLSFSSCAARLASVRDARGTHRARGRRHGRDVDGTCDDVWWADRSFANDADVKYYGAMRNMTNGQYYQQSARRSRGNRRIHQGPPLAPMPRANETTPAVELRTKTIRNDVNLKKGSLKLVPVEGKSNEYVLEFTFDAATQCFVSVFVNVAEVPTNRCSLHPAENLKGKRTCCAKGLRQTYVLPEECAINVKETLEDASNHSTESNQDFHNVVIRLETVQDEGEEGHTIQDQPPGSPFPNWVQSQTTYASLEMQDEGHYDLRIKKQKIWVEGTSYELQEIYGIEPVMGEAVLGDDDSGRECVICLSEPRDTTVLPCRHMCMCNKCARMLREKSNNCPICRKPVESLLEIKVGQRSAATEGSSGTMTGAVATR